MPKNKGFTALELMVTIGIIAIIAAIGIPAYTKYIPKYKLGKDATNLKADLERAKLAAKRENMCVSVVFTDTTYTIFKDNSSVAGQSCNRVRNGSKETLVEYRELSPGITFDNSGLRITGALFRGTGEASEGTIRLESYSGGGRKDLNISFLGRVQIE